MKRYLTFLTAVLLLFFLFTVVSCSEAGDIKKDIIGKWIREDYAGEIEFFKDGTLDVGLGVLSYKFIADGKLLEINHEGSKIVQGITIDKQGQLIITDRNNGKSKTFIRKAEIEEREKKRFIFSDLTVSDKKTKLMWTRDANIASKRMEWNDAVKFIESLNQEKYAGYSDWRLPSKEELETLENFVAGKGYLQGYLEKFNKLFLSIGFKNVQAGSYWLSSTDANGTRLAWQVSMGMDTTYGIDRKSTINYIWTVRGGQ